MVIQNYTLLHSFPTLHMHTETNCILPPKQGLNKSEIQYRQVVNIPEGGGVTSVTAVIRITRQQSPALRQRVIQRDRDRGLHITYILDVDIFTTVMIPHELRKT